MMHAEPSSFPQIEEVNIECKHIKIEPEDHLAETSAPIVDNTSQLFSIVRFDCRLCKFSSESTQTIEDHVNVHAHEKLYHSFYECRECLAWIESENSLRRHYESHFTKEEGTSFGEADLRLQESDDATGSDESDRLSLTEMLFSGAMEPITQIVEENEVKSNPLRRECSEKFTSSAASKLKLLMAKRSDERPFVCDERPEKFKRKEPLDRHNLTHSGAQPFTCNYCSIKFTSEDNLQKHIKKLHPGQMNGSGEVFAFTQNAESCDIKSVANPLHKCALCLKDFLNQTTLKNHMLTHTDERPFGCDICFEKFKRKETLNRHKLKHSDQKLFECSQCTEKYTRMDSLRRHMAKHTGELKHECHACKKKFFTKWELDTHSPVHTDVQKLKPPKKDILCEICSRTFRRLDELKVHMMRHTGEKPFACEKCPYRTHDPNILKVHMKAHNRKSEREFECDECSKKFRVRSALKMHMMRHNGNRQYECLLCLKKFYTNALLQRHISGVHKGEKKYNCTECSQKYAEKRTLRDHIQNVHSGQARSKSFKCDECEKSYYSKHDLKSHIRLVHDGERRHACECCPKKFKTLANLRTHVQSHEIKCFPCSICHREFPSKQSLGNHTRSQHKNE